MNIIELLTKPIHLMSADELLLALPISLFILLVSVLNGVKIIDRITRSWQDAAPEDENKSFHEMFTREDLEAVVKARQQRAWEKFKNGEPITESETRLIGQRWEGKTDE